MVASRAAMTESAAKVALEMAEHMETLAAAGEWEQVEDIVIRLRGIVTSVPEEERRDVLLAVQRSTEHVEAQARSARQSITGRMSELRRGQAAKKAYELR